jgi:hypothetical protein
MFRCRLLPVLLLLLSATSLRAQSPLADITATVTDPHGAALPHAQVSLQPTEGPGTTQSTETDAHGVFHLSAQPGCLYSLHIQAPGFAPFETSVTSVTAGSTLEPIALILARVDENITVQGSAAEVTIDPEETQVGTSLSEHQLADVPLNGRSFTDLLAISPGVVPQTSAQPNAVVMSGVASTPPSGDLDVGALSVSGQRETANSFRVNGANVQEDVNMGVAIVPTLDSIAELKVLTDSFDARLGNQAGGQIQLTTRSGADSLHGSAYEYLRNTALDARSYFSLSHAPFHQNQFGGTLGGPALAKRLFYFADYQRTRQTQGIDSGLISVPSAPEHTGDLSDRAALLTGSVNGDAWAQTLSQRLGQTVTVGEPYAQLFPNGSIPLAAWSAPALHLVGYLPTPNIGSTGFATASAAQSVADNKGALRLDTQTPAGAASLYGFLDQYSLVNPYPTGQGGATVPGFSARNQGRAQLLSAALVTTIGVSTVNQAHLGALRNAATVGQPIGGQGVSLSQQGFVTGPGTLGIVPGLPQIQGVENIVFNSLTLGTDVTGLTQAENIFEASNDLTRTLRSHTLSFGATFHADQINTHPDIYDNGSFTFTGSESGLDFADFLLGIDSSYTQGQGQNFYNRNHYLGLYAQDSWKARPNITLNYGLRWDLLPPWSEKYNQLLSLDPSEQSVVFPNAPQGILFPGDPGVARTLAPTRWNGFAPRVALSWSPTGAAWGHPGQTALRAGYGLYRSAFEGLSAGIMSGNPPYGFTDTSSAPTLFDQPFVTAATGASVGQRFPLQSVPFGASPSHPYTQVDWANFEPLTGIPAFDRNNRVPYTENYTLSFERALNSATTLQLTYVGTQAHHLLAIQEVNPGNPAACLALSQPSQVAPGSATCGPFNESSTFTTAAGATIVGTRGPYSGAFGSVNLQRTIANAHDNALEVNLRHQGQRLFFQLAYTFSRSIDQSSSLAEPVYPASVPGAAGASRALSAFDIAHNLSADYHYELPLAEISTVLAHASQRLVQGWQISGLTRFSTGMPVTLVNNNDTSLLGTPPNGINNNGIDEPQLAPGPLRLNFRPGPQSQAFNTSLFTLPALGTLGNARRRFFAGPGAFNSDLALTKSTHLHDTLDLNLRAEAFNVFNHSQFFGPATINGNLSAANFGQIQAASPPRLMQLVLRLTF